MFRETHCLAAGRQKIYALQRTLKRTMCLPVHFPVPKIELFNKVQLNRYKALVNYFFEILLLHNLRRFTHSCAMQRIRSYQLNSIHKHSDLPWMYPSRCSARPLPLPQRLLQTERSSASSFNFYLLLFSLK